MQVIQTDYISCLECWYYTPEGCAGGKDDSYPCRFDEDDSQNDYAVRRKGGDIVD
ncbi:hypothetical protein LCGC14_1340400 [marine sediment metagenome]|uniref:Uncharacterized protein n=1 Tax=marine sediment metagenome TaxID=412755 RepID=A0A0F9KDQ5_9ZZZZ